MIIFTDSSDPNRFPKTPLKNPGLLLVLDSMKINRIDLKLYSKRHGFLIVTACLHFLSLTKNRR